MLQMPFVDPIMKVVGGSNESVSTFLKWRTERTLTPIYPGAHLPGFDASSWNDSCSPLQGRTTPGVTVYRTTFDLNLPRGSDVPLAFDFTLDNANPHRVLIYVNGWQFGRSEAYPIALNVVIILYIKVFIDSWSSSQLSYSRRNS